MNNEETSIELVNEYEEKNNESMCTYWKID